MTRPLDESRTSKRLPAEGLGTAAPRRERLARFHENVVRIRRRLRISETTWLLALAALAGLLAGLGSIAFHYLIGVFQYLAFGTGAHAGVLELVMRPGYPWWRLVLAPALGGLVVGPLIHFLAREAKGHGVPAVIRAVHERGGRISPVIALVKTVASAVTLGSGGSLGREGPVVQIGASLGSGVGQLLGVTPKQLRMLAAGGAAAGLAAIFNAPLGGAFFSLEVIVGSFAMEAFGPVVVASVAATVVSRAILGEAPVIAAPHYQLEHTYELLVYVILGLASGAVAVVFTRGIAAGVALFERVPLPEWARPCLGGGLVGLLAVLVTPRILGNGYDTVEALMNPRGELEVVLVLLIGIKLVATSITLGSGGSGGVFGPTMFLGAVLGSLVGKLAGLFIVVAPAPAYALVGMAAFVAGATHAPVSMVLMIFEMSGEYRIVLPLLIASSIASLLAKRLYVESVDTVLDARQGRRIHKNVEEMALGSVTVGQAARVVPEAVVVPGAPVRVVLERFLSARTELVAVVDANGRYRGAIPARGLKESAEAALDAATALIALDIMRTDLPTLGPDEPLTRAIDRFHGVDSDALPVVRPGDSRFIGFLSEGDIVSAYRTEILRVELVSTVPTTRASSVVEFPADVVTVEVPVPRWLAGKTLAETQLRTTYGVSVLGVKDEKGTRLPDPAAALLETERLVVIGQRGAIESLRTEAP